MSDFVQSGLLYETYGFILTEKQKELFEAYFYEDLSLSEIAENRQISKQAVSDQINRCLDKMQFLEDHLHLLDQEGRAGLDKGARKDV